MLDTSASFDLTKKQKSFLQYYAVTHKTSVSDVMRSLVDQLASAERLREIEVMKNVKTH